MKDLMDVTTQATKGMAEDLAREFEVTLSRMYEILSKDNPIPKSKRLIRAVSHCDRSDDKYPVKLIKADFDALFSELLGDQMSKEIDCALLHAELTDVIKARLEKKTKAERLNECREAISILNDEIAFLEK